MYKNDLVSGVYEMGSIIKPITMASALDAGVVDENTFIMMLVYVNWEDSKLEIMTARHVAGLIYN